MSSIFESFKQRFFIVFLVYYTYMRLKTFLIIFGLWVAFLPHIGFSIATENVLFSISGFICIVASFYVAAIEDRHQNKRIIKDSNLTQVSEKISNKLRFVRPIKSTSTKRTVENQTAPAPHTESEAFENPIPEDDGRPRIRKAVSDVKINMDSVDDIVS